MILAQESREIQQKIKVPGSDNMLLYLKSSSKFFKQKKTQKEYPNVL